MMTSCSVSSGVTARMLPSTMVWMFTEAGDSEIMNRPRPKKEVKIRPMMASSLSLVRWLRKQHGAGGQAAREEGAEREGQPEHVGAGDARNDGMRKRVADQRPALQHQIGREERADPADQRAHPHGVDHVAVGKRFGEQRASFAGFPVVGSRRCRQSRRHR